MIYINGTISFIPFLYFLFCGTVISVVYSSSVLSSSLKIFPAIDHIILNGFNPKSIIDVIKKTIIDIARCDALAIYTITTSKDCYDTYTNHNLTRDFHISLIRQNNKFLSNVIKTNKASILTNFYTKPSNNFPAVLIKYGFETCVFVPLISKDKPIGLLLLLSKEKREYKKREIQYIEGISQQLVRALDNIQHSGEDMNIGSVFKFIKTIGLDDPYTIKHSLQVAELAYELGRHLDLSEAELGLIKFAGLLHDVGKVGIPEQILNKPSALDDYEWKIMKKHPEKSAEIIKEIDYLKEAVSCILHHHEKWDGTGYPEGLKGNDIPFFSRILAICDTYSAMISDRPYRKALSNKEVRSEVEKFKGKQFDPEVVDVFLKLPDEFLRRVIDK